MFTSNFFLTKQNFIHILYLTILKIKHTSIFEQKHLLHGYKIHGHKRMVLFMEPLPKTNGQHQHKGLLFVLA